MKLKIIVILSALFLSISASAEFPYTVEVEIEKLEVWPSNTGYARYAGFMKDPYTEPGCTHPRVFYIEAGPGAEAAYSTLLAAQMAGKKVELYFTRCAYGAVADRVRVIFE